MQYRNLGRTGASVSILGFGCSPLGDVFGVTDPSEGARAVHYAIERGINFFDVSPYYGATLAESRLGTALKGKREKVFLATKCGRYGFDSFDFSAGRIQRSIDESLRRLNTDFVDLFQAHDVEFANSEKIVNETIPAMREIQRQGKTRFIGITGFQLRQLAAIAEATPVDTILSYCRYNLLVTDLDSILTPVAKSREIGLINASPLHMGLLTGRDVPSWHPSSQEVRQAASAVVRLCREQNIDPALVALRFALDHPYVATTLIGMATTHEVEQNLRALNLDLASALMEAIEQLVGPAKNTVWPSGLPENADHANLEQGR